MLFKHEQLVLANEQPNRLFMAQNRLSSLFKPAVGGPKTGYTASKTGCPLLYTPDDFDYGF